MSDLAGELQLLSRAQRWDEMSGLISDEVLHTYATVGLYDDITERLYERYGRVVTHAEFSLPVGGDDERDRLSRLVGELQAKPPPAALTSD